MSDADDEEMLRAIVRVPTDAEVKIAFGEYVSAVGEVAHAWNYLHERLGRLFVRIVGGHDSVVTAAVWYSSYSDRSQRDMLEAAIKASNDPAFQRLPKKAKSDLLWLLDEVRKLGGKRDDAVHAPCVLSTSIDGTQMAPSLISGHRRAKNLVGKVLIAECDQIKARAENLSRFTVRVIDALDYADSAWPEKPPPPTRKPKKAD